MKPCILLPLFLLPALPGAAQPLPIDNDYRFRDGLYQTAAQWRADAPCLPAEQCRVGLAPGSSFEVLQVQQVKIRVGEGWQPLPLDSLWGLTLEGEPYICMGRGASAAYFQRIFQLGRISFFAYRKPEPIAAPARRNRAVKTYQDGTQEMQGLLLNQSRILHPDSARSKRHNQKKIATSWLLFAPDGRLLEATPENLRLLLADDPELAAEFARENEPESRVFSYVLRYNQRNIYYPENP